MRNRPFQSIHAAGWLYLFILLHVTLWTLAPAWVRVNLPLDAIEGTIWGHQLEWGYDKNPYLNGWLTALATYLDGQSGWMIYLFSQLSVGTCFWAVWQLGKRMLMPAQALIAVLILESIQYYNFHAIDFNDNTLELGLWALTTYYFYRATREPRYRFWILTGLFAGLGMMAKYYTAALLAGMGLFFFTDSHLRQQLKTPLPYVGCVAFLTVTLPHFIWLFSHEFITVTYVFARASNKPSWLNHFFFPAQFAWQQLEAFFPAIILSALLFFQRARRTDRLTLSSFDRRFLGWVGMGPFLLTVLLSFVGGITLRAGWGMPLQSLWGIILVATLQPLLTPIQLRRFIALIFILMSALIAGYILSLTHAGASSTANFPGQQIANQLTAEWHQRYHTKLAYVAGSRWVGGNVGFYSSDHPAVFIEWNPKHAPWIVSEKLREQGAIFIWEISKGERLPASVQQQHPHLLPSGVYHFEAHRRQVTHSGRPDQPIQIGVAFLPPTSA